jgi:sporulation protein YlmC with PRC-barrel domain
MQLKLGTSVRCRDDSVGELTDVVIDPIEKRVTHLVVVTDDGGESARLIPVELAHDYARSEIALDCAASELTRFESVREYAYLPLGEQPDQDPKWDIGVEDVLATPTAGAEQVGDYVGELSPNVAMTYDRVPKGEVELRRSSGIESADGHFVGHIDGIVIDDAVITSLTLERGHLWWRKDVTIPVESVSSVSSDSVTLSLTRDQIAALPAVRARRRPK